MKIILDFLRQFDWIDILVLIIFLRIAYIALKNGLAAEFFKIFGTLSALYLSLHYYTPLAGYFAQRLGLKNKPVTTLEFVLFVALALIGYGVFLLLRLLLCRYVTTEITPNLSKWAGLVVGVARSFLLSSLVLFALFASSVSYFKKSIDNSFSGRCIINIAPTTYSWFWFNLISKFKTNDKFNKAVLDVNLKKTK